jgi:hypothetical protein
VEPPAPWRLTPGNDSPSATIKLIKIILKYSILGLDSAELTQKEKLLLSAIVTVGLSNITQ